MYKKKQKCRRDKKISGTNKLQVGERRALEVTAMDARAVLEGGGGEIFMTSPELHLRQFHNSRWVSL